MTSRTTTFFAPWLAAALLSCAVACLNEGSGREETTASSPKGGPLSGDATKGDDDGGGAEDGVDDVGTGDGEPAKDPVANSRSLEQCTAEKKAWRAVVNSGKSPSDCVEELVTWCCTEEEIAARFPTMAGALKTKFAKTIEAEKHVLYHCSYDAATKRHTFHTAKITPDGKTNYQYVFVKDVFPVDTGSGSTGCNQVTTDDLTVDDGGSGTDEPTGIAFADVQPIVEAKCGGAACHDDGGPLRTAAEFVNDEARFKATGTARIDDGSMPPSGSTALTAEEKTKLLEFLSP